MRVLLVLLAALVLAPAANAGFSDGGDVCQGVTCGGSYSYCANYSVGREMVYNGSRWRCTSGRNYAWFQATWVDGYGWFNNYPQVLDCPCYFWRAI